MNKQGNLYTIIYTAVIVCVVGAALAWVSLTLKPKQNDNIRIDKMQQMLSSLHVVSDKTNAIELYDKYIVDEYIIDSSAKKVDGNAFDVNVANEVKKDASERLLPVFVCNIDNSTKYILPVYGTGLWGPIWGYVSVNDDGCTVYGAYFSHQGETPGLGAEIATENFARQFDGKQLFKDGSFKSVAVLKKGQNPVGGEDYVDALSGGTIPSKGVQSMLFSCLSCYSAFLSDLQNNKK